VGGHPARPARSQKEDRGLVEELGENLSPADGSEGSIKEKD